MEIEDIQENEFDKNKLDVLFSDDNGEVVATIVISKDDAWVIAEYCKNHLSVAAQNKG